MNCQRFQGIVQDLNTDSCLDLQTRQEALAHAEVCRECADRLRDEHRLIAGLNAVAASAAGAEAPARVEEVLLNAFHSRELMNATERRPRLSSTAAGNQPPAAVATARQAVQEEQFSLNRGHGLWRAWSIRIAAVGLLVAGLAAWLLWHSSNQSREGVADRAKSPMPETTSQSSRSVSSLPEIPPRETERSPHLPAKATLHANGQATVERSRPDRTAWQSGRTKAQMENDATFDQPEIATEFVPLSYGESLSSSLEGGQLVRVQLPRATLLSFGFPMSEERAPEPIKADVLLGEDGVARAIRFVH
jgi:hypothetical protein